MEDDFGKNDATGDSQKLDITTRLAALNRWQEEQKRLLEERQNKQRQMLGMEQRNMYQMLGLLHKSAEDEKDAMEGSILEAQDETLSDNDDQEDNVSQPVIQMPRHAGYQLDESCVDIQQTEKERQQTARPKRPFLRRGEGLKQRFKINPDQLRINNLPRYKFANAHPEYRSPAPAKQKRSILKTSQKTEPAAAQKSPALPSLDLNEQRFQQLLISSKNACNSTPDLKSSYASSSSVASVSPKVRFVELNPADDAVEQTKGQSADDENSSVAASGSSIGGLCWAKVLDTQQIQPLPLLQRRTAQIRVENEDNVSIFELLEQKAREGNIDMNSSCIRAFMARKEQGRAADESDQMMLSEHIQTRQLQPAVREVLGENEEELDDTMTLTPLQVGKTQVRVRFSDSNDTHEYADETTMGGGSNVELFDQFKSALFQALQQRQQQATPADEPLAQELQEKANLVRVRLEELEAEIATFKEHNQQLLKLKQQHELEQAQCTAEHQAGMDRVHDEKIQAEIYLHDERMKIEEERRKFEQQMRLQKSNVNSKDKKELAALKQEVEALQLQLKQKEQTHVSAQARLRAQLRATEKEQRSFRDEIELLSRENKRLEQELVRIGRENNKKMLQEINRNIARLAPKAATASEGNDENERRNKSLEAVAKQAEASRRQSCNGSSQNHGRSRSIGRAKKSLPPPPPLEESFSSSCESEDAVAPIEASPEPNKADNSAEFKREIVNADGSKDIWYPNGNLKKISADGMNVRMLYFNKDIKETDIRAGTVKYYYAETNTWHTSYLDGLEILEFPNGQTEHRHKSGTIEIHFPNNSIKIVDPSDAEKLEEWRYEDGTHLVQLRNGDKILNLPNGQKEIHTKLNKRREYPDGTVKLVYPDGSQETRYSNGRVRLKDKEGKLIMDTDYAKY